MDDNFNSNNIFGEDTPSTSPSTSQYTQSETGTGTQSGSPLGTAPSGNGQYYTPYNGIPYNQQPSNSQNSFNNGSFNTNSTQSPYSQQSPYGNPQKKKTNTGRNVFAVLICCCIVIASVAIGFSIFGNRNSPVTKSEQSESNASGGNGTGASAQVEDSPVSYSEYSGSGTMTPEQIYETAKEINVGVIVYSQNEKSGEGSGIIVGADENKEYTYILTAAHVISDQGASVQIQFNDESELDAEIVGYDTKTDIGVLRVKKTGFKAATFGNSDKLNVGQKVYAIGNPGGTVFFGSFTDGIISAIDRPVESSSSAYDLPCIQHNAAINPGNSGGALLNEYGQVIGLNSSKIASTEYEGMGFSVPSNTLIEIYKEITENGYVTNRPMLGITYYSVASDYTYSAIAWKNNLPYGSIVIASITENSDLANNGIKVGDIITAVNGEALNTTDTLLELIESGNVGDTLTLSVTRLNSAGSISTQFNAKVKLIEDKGENLVTQQEATTDSFSNYFGNGFGY